MEQVIEYKKLTPEEMSKRGILGRLVGTCADIVNPTRNGRKYSEELWESVFNNPITKEYFDCGGVFGELGHPSDRSETDMEKIAICMPEPPVKNSNGFLEATYDILDTPNGRILKTLCDYGYKMGISSRGNGETFIDDDGNESVDPETYDFSAFDVVLLPAVKEARLSYVNESLGKKTLKQALCEELDKASEDDRRVMEETLKNLDLSVDDNKECNSENCTDKKDVEAPAETVGSAKVESLEELQVALKQKAELESKIVELNEKLSVGYAKEANQEEELAKYKKAVAKLSESAKNAVALNEKVSKLTEELEQEKNNNATLTAKVQKLEENAKLRVGKNRLLQESVDSSNKTIAKLNESIKGLTQEKESLNESVAELKKDLDLKKLEYSQKIENSNKLVEKYQKIASGAVNKYIESLAVKIGVSPNEIKNKLPESYTFDDIDSIGEDLQSYKLTMSKLPFQTRGLKENMKVRVSPSKNEALLPANNVEDEVDESLLRLAGLV